MSAKLLDCLEEYSLSGENPVAVVIWLHGLGADYNDFVPVVPQLGLSKCVKFIFPNAPTRPITINNGYVMRAWYDISDIDRIDASIDFDGINESVAAIDALVEQQIGMGFRSEQIILAGFSQGGVISYTAGLTSKHKLGGIIALSCYLPGIDKLIENSAPFHKTVPIFAAHGLHDSMVPYAIGSMVYQSLESAGFKIDWSGYAMEHSLCIQEIGDISQWIEHII